MNDAVNHPAHYTSGKYEVIDFIENRRFPYHLGNAVKYICRAGKKDPAKTVEDLEKARWYVLRFIEKEKSYRGFAKLAVFFEVRRARHEEGEVEEAEIDVDKFGLDQGFDFTDPQMQALRYLSRCCNSYGNFKMSMLETAAKYIDEAVSKEAPNVHD